MTQDEYFQEFKAELVEMYKLTRAKNMDYAGAEDAFKNFKQAEALGITTTEKGILVRMSDKLQRVCNLIDKDANVKTESILDTLVDNAVYSIILMIYLKSKNNERNLEASSGEEVFKNV